MVRGLVGSGGGLVGDRESRVEGIIECERWGSDVRECGRGEMREGI